MLTFVQFYRIKAKLRIKTNYLVLIETYLMHFTLKLFATVFDWSWNLKTDR